jgi:Lysozyme like domain
VSTWALQGRQLTYGWALAVCHHAGFRGRKLITAAALMTAESGRFAGAWHQNAPDSVDRGLFQINSKAHPAQTREQMYQPIPNAGFARRLSHGGDDFTAWAAFNSNAHLKYVPAAAAAWALPRWRRKVPMVEEVWGPYSALDENPDLP